jgi:hypothetical protein
VLPPKTLELQIAEVEKFSVFYCLSVFIHESEEREQHLQTMANSARVQ